MIERIENMKKNFNNMNAYSVFPDVIRLKPLQGRSSIHAGKHFFA